MEQQNNETRNLVIGTIIFYLVGFFVFVPVAAALFKAFVSPYLPK